MRKRNVNVAGILAILTVMAFSLTGCGERPNTIPEVSTEKSGAAQTEKITEKATENAVEAETESETPKLITSVDYTSKDGSVKITLPDNTWKVTQDADEMRVFQSGNAAIVNIIHANTETSLKNLSVYKSEDELRQSLTGQYSAENAFEIEDFIQAEVNGVSIYRYTVKYNAAARMWAYSVTNAIVAADQAYVVNGTVTDDNKPLLEAVKKSVESFRVLQDEVLKNVTGEVLSGTTQANVLQQQQTVNPNTASAQELTSLKDYGTTATLVTTDTVNVRAQPGTDAGILTTLNGKTSVTVIGETANWFKVNIGGNIGFIRKDFLVYGNAAQAGQNAETDAPSADAQSAAETSTATNYGAPVTLYASSDVNVRTAPGTDSAVAGSLPAGTSVTVVGETDNWFIVSIGGNTQYVSKAYLTYDSSVSNGTSAESTGTAGQSQQGNSGAPSVDTSLSAVSGTVVGSTVDTLTIQGDDGNIYHVYYGDANTSSQDGLYDGVYVSVSLDSSQAAGDGTLYATGVTGY